MITSPEVLKPKEAITHDYSQEKRDYNDTITWMAEVLDGQMRSRFDYHYDGQDIIANDGGPLRPVFENALSDARQKAVNDQCYDFEFRRRQAEYREYQDILAMARGETSHNTIVVVSDFPQEVSALGSDFGGYNACRRQTMLRIITKNPDGGITMTSQSLDGSDRTALESIYQHLGAEPAPGELLGQRIYLNESAQAQAGLTDELTAVYDSSLSFTRGGQWYAGRSGSDRQNTVQFAINQTDLINAYLLGPMDQTATYNLSAAITARFKNRHSGEAGVCNSNSSEHNMMLAVIEMQAQGRLASTAGKTFSGCGATLGSGNSAENQLTNLGYSDGLLKADEDQYGSLKFKCKHGHQNTRPRGKLIPNCQSCGVSVRC